MSAAKKRPGRVVSDVTAKGSSPVGMRVRSIEEYLDARLGNHQGRGAEKKWWCPVCIDRIGDEGHKPHLCVNSAKGVGHCFRCGFRFRQYASLFRAMNGGVLRMCELVLLRKEVVPPHTPDLVEVVRGMLRGRVEREALNPVLLPPEAVGLHGASGFRVRKAWKYLAERGIRAEQVEAWNLHYCPEGEYAFRVVFPVVQGGQLVYFTTRFCGQHPRKSKNPPSVVGSFAKGDCLLNYDNVVGEPVVALVEGAFDAMAHAHAVALMGKTISDVQVRLLRALVPYGLEEVVVSLDSDARSSADELCERLSGILPRVTVLYLDEGDPHDRREQLEQLLETRRIPTLRDIVRNRMTRLDPHSQAE